jgi:hypothetical protein
VSTRMCFLYRDACGVHLQDLLDKCSFDQSRDTLVLVGDLVSYTYLV